MEPAYRASLEYALAQRALPPASPQGDDIVIDMVAGIAWAGRMRAGILALGNTAPDMAALAEATRPGRLGAPSDRVPDQVFVMTRGLTPITCRFFAALAESGLGDWGCTVLDTGMPEEDAARLTSFLRARGIDVSMARGDSMRIATPEVPHRCWGGEPRFFLLLNDDTVPLPGFCQHLARLMDQNPRYKLISAASNTPLDLEVFRPGFEEGPEDTLLERTWAFGQRRAALHGNEVGNCMHANFTCAAVDWRAWRDAMPTPTPFDFGHHYDLHCGFSLLQAGHLLGTAEGCAIYHVGHTTYRNFSEAEIYDTVLERTRKLIDVWGHRPEFHSILHTILAASTNFRHH